MASTLRNAVTIAVAGALMAFSHVAAAGGLIMKINGFLCADNDFCDADLASNAISVTPGALGVPTIPGLTVAIASSSNNPGGAGGSSIYDLTWNASRSIGSGGSPALLTIEASQNDFNFPAGGQLTHLDSFISGSLQNGVLTGQQFISLTNTFFDPGLTPGPQGPFNAAFTDSAGLDFIAPAAYAFYEWLTITLGADASSSGEFRSTTTTRSVPEPAMALLLGFALAALGFAQSTARYAGPMQALGGRHRVASYTDTRTDHKSLGPAP